MVEITTQDIEGLHRVRGYCDTIGRYLPSELSHRISIHTLEHYVPVDRIVIAGGFMADAFRNEVETTKDVDVFLLDCIPGSKFPFDWRITREQAKNYAGGALGSFDPMGGLPINSDRPPEILESMITKFMYPVALSISSPSVMKMGNAVINSRWLPINLVSTTYKTRKELIDHFDMAQCQIHYALDHTDKKWKVFATRKTLDLIHNKQIAMSKTYVGALKPWRVERYTSRGWTHAVPSV